MTAPQSPVDVLRAARKLIDNPEAWTQGAYARTAHGLATDNQSPDAVCFCAQGALWTVSHQDKARGRAGSTLNLAMGLKGIIAFNDAHCHVEVLAAFDRAIALAEQAGS